MLKYLKVIVLVVALYCSSLTAADTMQTVTSWVEHCFTNLPEYKGPGTQSSLLGIPFIELKSLFFEYIKLLNDHEQSPFSTGCSTWFSTNRVYGSNLVDIWQDAVGDTAYPFISKVLLGGNDTLYFVGDLHGSVHSLLRLLLRLKKQGVVSNDWQVAAGSRLIFLGDFVDRGAYGVECFATLLKLLSKNFATKRVMLTRGNHEEKAIWDQYGFAGEIARKIKDDETETINGIKVSQQTFVERMYQFFCASLPYALFICRGDTVVQCCHGGVEPRVVMHENFASFLDASALHASMQDFARTLQDLLCDGFNWSDFTGRANQKVSAMASVYVNVKDSFSNYWDDYGHRWMFNSGRRVGFLADIADTQNYLEKARIKAIFRGHQDQEHCCKIIVAGENEPVSIARIQASFSYSQSGNGITMRDFIIEDNRPPVFTTTTAVEARKLPDEGFYKVQTADDFADWKVCPLVYPVAYQDNRYVHVAIDSASQEFVFSWDKTKAADFSALHDPVTLVSEQLSALKNKLKTLQDNLRELAKSLQALKNKVAS